MSKRNSEHTHLILDPLSVHFAYSPPRFVLVKVFAHVEAGEFEEAILIETMAKACFAQASREQLPMETKLNKLRACEDDYRIGENMTRNIELTSSLTGMSSPSSVA